MGQSVIAGQISLFEVPLSEALNKPLSETILKPLTLEEVNGLDMGRSQVWIETKPYPTRKPDELLQFFLLFPALFTYTGIPIGSTRRNYHFMYVYNKNNYEYHRVDEFYGREWRVWAEKPTDDQRKAEAWQ